MKQLYILIFLIFTFTACLPLGDQNRRIKKTACTENTQCTTLNAAYVCLSGGYCGECDDSHNCPSGKICEESFCVEDDGCSNSCSGNTPFCFEGSCAECSASSGEGCELGYFCNQNKECELEPDCTPPSTCSGTTPYCYNDQCVACSLFSNQTCAEGYTCNTGNNTCSIIVGTRCPNMSPSNMACKYSNGTSATCKCGVLESTQHMWVIPTGQACSSGSSISGCESGTSCVSGVCTATGQKILDAPCSPASSTVFNDCVYWTGGSTYSCKCGTNQSNLNNKWVIPYNYSCKDDTSYERCEYTKACNANTNKCGNAVPSSCNFTSVALTPSGSNGSIHYNLGMSSFVFTSSTYSYNLAVTNQTTNAVEFSFSKADTGITSISFYGKDSAHSTYYNIPLTPSANSLDFCFKSYVYWAGTCNSSGVFRIYLNDTVTANSICRDSTFKLLVRHGSWNTSCPSGGTDCDQSYAYTFKLFKP